MIILTDKTIVIPVGISPNYSGVNKPSLEDKSVEITENGDYSYTASEAYYGIGNFNVKVNVEIPVESSKTVNPSFEEDVTVLPSEGFDAMSSVIVKKAEANLEDKSVQITENGDYNYTTSAPYNGIGNVNVKVNVQEKKIRYAIRPTSGRVICPFTNVLLNETSWVSLDFAMDTSSLSKEKACLFGISASSLHCYLNNGVLHMYTGEEVPMNKQITLDTNKHTLEFGFVTKADESGHAEFEVIFDGEMIADVMVLVPTYNAPLSLFDIAGAYYDQYDSYIEEGGIIRLVNGTGYGVGDSVFDLFSLTVYDKPGYYRNTIHAYTPSVDAGNKPIFIDNITGEYQYPASGTYSYAKINGDTRTEIASASYTMPFSNDFQYFRPSEGAIIPTDIELPALHRITMYVKDIDSFDAPADGVTEHDALAVVKSRVMIGAQPVLVAPFNHLDYERRLPRLPINESHTAILGDASVGLFNQGFEVYSGYTYSIYSEYGTPQALASLNGEHTIKFGQRFGDIHYIETFFILDDNQDYSYTRRGIIMPNVIDRVNERQMTPLCIFGTYNFVEGTKPDYVNSLGYQNALNQIGYTTGVRYAVKQIDIEEFTIDTKDTGRVTLRHRLVTNTDNNGVNCLFDTITGTTYYPYNGTLDVYTGPVEPEPPVDPEPPVTPDASILTDTYVKASADAIVPTDIKLPVYHSITMHVKDIEDVVTEGVDPGSLPLEEKLNLVRKKVMIGAQGELIAPFDHVDYESNFQFDMPVNEENTAILADASGGIYYKVGGNMTSHNGFSIVTSNGGTPQKLTSFNGEHIIKCGVRMADSNSIWKFISIDSEDEAHQLWNGVSSDRLNNFSYAPLCVFGTYNVDESKKPDDVIALGYENALNQIGYTTGVRYSVKQIDIAELNADGSMTTKHSLVPARDVNDTICLYDTVSNKSYYPFHGTLDVYTGPVEPEPPVTPDASILTNTYIKPSAGAIVPTDIKLPTLHGVKMYIKDIDAFDENVDSTATGQAALDIVQDRVMIGAQPDLIAPFNHVDYEKGLPRLVINESTTAVLGDTSIGFFHQSVEAGYGGISYSIQSPYGGTAPQVIPSLTGEHIIDFGTKYLDNGNLWVYCDISDTPGINLISIGVLSPDSITYTNNRKMAPLCIFGTYNYVEGKTPDDVIALGYQDALSQIGYKTGVRYAVKQIDIEEYAVKNDDRYGEPIATLHSLVPARDKDGIICLYDTVSNKSYYPFHGTLDII